MIAGAGSALFRLVRFWSRRWAQTSTERASVEQSRVHDIAVLDAAEAAAQLASQVSVAEVAHQLGIDRSGASRFISAAVEHGYLDRRPSPEDGRQVLLTPTAAGRRLLQDSHAWQDEVFAQMTATWAPADAARLGEYLQRLASELPPSNPEQADTCLRDDSIG